jgi:hypothetical protein
MVYVDSTLPETIDEASNELVDLDRRQTYAAASEDYMNRYPDVRAAGMDAWSHYLRYGKNEGRTWNGKMYIPNTTFEKAKGAYLKQNPDVKGSGMDPWEHYKNRGRHEGRLWRGPQGNW